MKMFLRRWIWLALVGVVMSGCTILGPVKDTTRYYLVDTPDYEPVFTEAVENPKMLGLGRVRVARYLESPGITVRERLHSVNYASRNRWAEPLDVSVIRVLTENLETESVIKRVLNSALQRTVLPDYDLEVLVSRAEGMREVEGGSRAVFRATWVLRSGSEAKLVASGAVREDDLPWDGEDFDQLAASISAGVEELTRQIARAVAEGEVEER